MLSRICDAGLDYSQRTNKFAHYVVLDAAEVPAMGPAALMAKDGFMRSKWEGEPCVVPTGPAVPSGDISAACVPCLAAAYRRCGLGGRAGRNGRRQPATARPC